LTLKQVNMLCEGKAGKVLWASVKKIPRTRENAWGKRHRKQIYLEIKELNLVTLSVFLTEIKPLSMNEITEIKLEQNCKQLYV